MTTYNPSRARELLAITPSGVHAHLFATELRAALAEIERLNRLMTYRQVSETKDVFGNITILSMERAERYNQECGGTIDILDESGFGSGCSVGRAIGQPPVGDAVDGEE